MEQLLVRLDERSKNDHETLDEILINVKSTNGRVTALEKWRDVLIGQWRLLVPIATAVGTVLGFLIKHYMS